MQALAQLLATAGWVSGPLLATSVTLWTVVGLRAWSLRRGFTGEVRPQVERMLQRPAPRSGPVHRYLLQACRALTRAGTCQHHLERFLQLERERVRDLELVLMGLVTIAPLLGLLGTVSGMVETFASMKTAALPHATEQTVAGGISQALVSTQLGLVIGVPGMAAARVLARLQRKRTRELSQAHSVLVQLRAVPP